MLNRVVGEERYDNVRVQRRILSNKFYYFRQQWLYQLFVEAPDIAQLLGIYPKTDQSHGFGYHSICPSTQTPMKCTEISRKTPSTVTVLSVCGSPTLPPFISSTKCTTISCRGTGTKLPPAKMVRSKESE